MQLLSTPVLRVPVDDRAIVAERERRRLDAVARYAILDSPAEEAIDRITRLAAQLFEVPMAFVSIVARDRTWFKSAHGLSAIAEIPREPGLCSTAIETNEPYVLEDASADERSRENSLVSGPLGVRFYAGVPLHTHDGHNLGALCVLDDVPHSIDDAKLDMLVTLGQVVVDELELRCRSAERAASIDSATGLLDRNALDSALDDYFAAFLRGTTSDGSLVAPARRDEFRLTREASTRTRRRSRGRPCGNGFVRRSFTGGEGAMRARALQRSQRMAARRTSISRFAHGRGNDVRPHLTRETRVDREASHLTCKRWNFS